ncbi:NADH-quinone oxidoreductase subunit C [Methanolacinia paynteri]|uniref:NADH-quinone oxidoreductase subunit C n=1 Tax=Methanolacinia paynteri TaxID=230356 RepID=UPI00064F5A29|nr:NADH-quinone oxidoreductase subunit C [Methanolacinia paynteri]
MTDTAKKVMTAEAVAERFASKFGDRIISSDVRQWCEGTAKTPINTIWMKVETEILHDAVAELISIDFPHLGVISAVDMIEEIDVLYHFTIFFGSKGSEITVTFTVSVPKDNPVVPTISDLIPGAVYSEREKQELMGVIVDGIPDQRGLFLPDDFPEGIYPWRKDDAGIRDDMVKDLWAVGRPGDRPNPPVKPKPEKKKSDEEPAKKVEKKPEVSELAGDEPAKDESKEEVKGDE